MSTSSNNLPSPKVAVKKTKKLLKEEFQLTASSSSESKKPLKRKLKADRLKEEAERRKEEAERRKAEAERQEKLNEETRLMREQEGRLKEEKLKEEKSRREKKAKLKGEEKKADKMEVDGYTTEEEELCQPNHMPFPSLYEINDVAYTTRIQVNSYLLTLDLDFRVQ